MIWESVKLKELETWNQNKNSNFAEKEKNGPGELVGTSFLNKELISPMHVPMGIVFQRNAPSFKGF